MAKDLRLKMIKEAMKATIRKLRRQESVKLQKKAKTAKFLRLDDDKKPRRLRRKAKMVNKPEVEDDNESQEGNEPEAGK